MAEITKIISEAAPQIVAQIFTFLIFFMIMKRFAWGPIMEFLESRRARIQAEFDEVAELKLEVENFKEEYTKKLAEMDDQAREKIQEGINEGRRIADEVAEKARQDAEERIEKSKQMIELEINKARKELKEDIVTIAMQVSEIAVRERLDDQKHRSLVDGFIDKLGSSN